MPSCDTYTITEYGGFISGEARGGYQGLPEKAFNALETFILANSNGSAAGSETEAVELLSLSARRGLGKIITARNYVGLITMNDGTVIEILPKIAGGDTSVSDTKRIFLEMLKTLKEINFKEFNISRLHAERMSLLEIFMKMFLDEVAILTKQGLKAAYTPVEENERFYRGKLLTVQNIRHNLLRRERFFVRYDDFNMNRPENRLIKTTLGFLLKTTGDAGNRQSAARLMSFFDSVEYSASIDGDFSKCVLDRSMNHYGRALSWCRIFLRGNSFTAFAESEIALALLFPMEQVFESFVAARLRKHIGAEVTMRTQDTKYSLFDSPVRAFALRPDIVLESGGKTVVLDTKWKLLSDNAPNSGISQSDMYQMYAYGKKYNADRVVLLYPYSDNLSTNEIVYTSNDNVKVNVSFINLQNVDESMGKLLSELYETSSKCVQ